MIGLVLDRSLSSKMDDNAARLDACQEYKSSLEDLTFNSKPHINMLTILAEENLHFAKDIVAIIEAQITKAPPTEKLPVLYLVDSIVKNVGGEYLAVFAKNLVTSFICVFEKVDENTRKSLFKLRCTWDDIFPLKKLYALDVRVNSVDPAWPIKPLPPTTNASIHVNPKFLKQSEEVSAPKASTPQPVAPPPQPVPSITEANFTREQVIRQQLLAKQKQLLELQQKKIELELEHTKAQLAGGYVITPATPAVSAPAVPTPVPKPASQSAPVIKPWMPPQTESKACTRDPRLNRPGPSAAPQPKEQPSSNKDGHSIVGSGHTPEKRLPEKTGKPDKTRAHKKDLLEEKPKSKSPSPMPRVVQSKNKHSEAERAKPPEAAKKDARVRKRVQDKAGEAKEDELKEKKRCTDKQEREDPVRAPEAQKSPKGKLVNGSLNKRDRTESLEKADFKVGGNARTNARKRTRSRSRSRSPTASPKRKDRRSPKGRARSSSSSPPPSHKPNKARRVHTDETQHGKSNREDRLTPKKSLTEPRRAKRPADERHAEGRESHSPRGPTDSKENKDSAHCWSGWKENKHLKLSEEPHGKPTLQRHKSYSGPPRPNMPRTPKHRLSVDANLQIPDVLNSASKRDLLRKASKRLESGEISQEDFLNVAHQIKQLFQYQEEIQRSDSWEASSEDGGQPKQFPVKKLLATRHSPQSHQVDNVRGSDLSYHKHKSKQRRTPVSRQQGEEWEGEDSQDEEEGPVGKAGSSSRDAMHPMSHMNTRPPRERQGERHSKEPEKHPPEQQPQAPMIEEYNHGKEFPKLKSGLRFKRRVDPRATTEREWNSPLTERQCYDDRGEQKSGYDTARRYGAHPDSRHGDPRRQEPPPPPPPPPPPTAMGHVRCPSPANLEGPAKQSPVATFEREPLSPLHPKDPGELSPVPRFESPNSEHSDDGPLNLDIPPPPRSILKQPSHSGPLASVRQHSDSPGHTPPHISDGGHVSRYDGPGHMGPSRSHPPGRYDSGPGRYDDFSRYDGPHQQGPGRFDGGRPPSHSAPERFNGPARYENPPMSRGPMRGGEGRGRPFEGLSHPQGSVRFNGPIGQQPPVRFEGQGPGPGHFDNPMQPNRFDRPQRFDNMGPGPGPRPGPGPGPGPVGFQQPCPMRFNGPPNQMGPARFDGPSPPGMMHFHGPGQPGPRYDMPNMPPQGMPPRFNCPPEQQGPPRFGPPNNMQPPMQPLGPPMYENPSGPPQQQGNFNMPNQCFPEPMNPQFAGGPLSFPSQQNVPQGGNFNVPPGPPFNQPAGPPFFNPGAPPAGNMQQPVNMMPNLGQPFLPQNPVPFRQPAPQFATPETHFGQVDVNDLLSKLISTGIIPAAKPPQPESAATTGTESPATPPVVPVVVEEEEEEEPEVEEDNPDLTGFVIDDMKQRYDGVVTKLYTGIQCYSCGMRFTASQTDVYADHLDWHYRQNRSEKDISKKVTHRHWYYSLTDWVEFEEIADLEERAKSQFFEKVNEEVVQKSQEAAKEKEFQSVKAATDVVAELCEICQEAFEMYWEEDEEEWHLKNAIRVDEKTYHPSCFEDYNKNTSSFLDTTPSPDKLLTEHPLSAIVKIEPEEEVEEVEEEEEGKVVALLGS